MSRSDEQLVLLALEQELRELRAMQRRLELGQLEAGDWAKLAELITKTIDEAEAAGQEEVLIELPDRDPER